MKTLRMFGMALVAILIGASLASCNKDKIQDCSDTITVRFNCAGDFLSVEETPLAKSTNNNYLYGIQVYTSTGNTMVPYAYGIFTSLENVTLELLKSQKYVVQALVIIDGLNSYSFDGHNIGYTSNPTEGFRMSTSDYLNVNVPGYYTSVGYGFYPYDGYYGRVSDYTPVDGGIITIDTKRVSCGIKLIASNLSDGTICVDLGNITNIELTTESPIFEQTYLFPDNFNDVIYFYDRTCESVECSISLKKDDESSTFLGSYSILIKPNVKTIVTIDVNSSLTTTNGIKVNIDTSNMKEENFILDNSGMNPA